MCRKPRIGRVHVNRAGRPGLTKSGFAFALQAFEMQEDGVARLGHGVALGISRREAAWQIGDNDAEGVLVVAGFNRDEVEHVRGSCFKLGLFPGIPEHIRRPARQGRSVQLHDSTGTHRQQARSAA